jgi:hypothetical protein
VDWRELQSRQAVAITIIAAIIAATAGIATGYNVSSRITTTITSSFTSTSVTTIVAQTTIITSSEWYQPCSNEVWNASSSNLGSEHVPVLLMRPNSTAYVCVTYQSAWQGNASLYQSNPIYNSYPTLVNGSYQFVSFLVGKYKCVTSNGSTSCTETDSHSFTITALPASIRPAASMDYVTVVYVITALGNSTGFYDRSAPWEGCSFIPMAVGYSATQVNSSDFTQLPLHSCFVQLLVPVAEYSTGMNLTYVNFTQS